MIRIMLRNDLIENRTDAFRTGVDHADRERALLYEIHVYRNQGGPR